MKITSDLTDTAILTELGERLAHARIDRRLTQAALADEAGVAKRTIERIEAGRPAEIGTLIRLLRVLGLSGGLDQLVPEAAPSPMALLKSRGRERRRAPRRRAAAPTAGQPWSWAE
jgi:transcriptional regulator with XRE-family HTH domain